MKRNEAINQAIKAISIVINGGKGSGNFGHADLCQAGSLGSKKTKVRTDVYMVPTNHKYVSVKTNTQGLKTYTYRRPDGSTYTIQTA